MVELGSFRIFPKRSGLSWVIRWQLFYVRLRFCLEIMLGRFYIDEMTVGGLPERVAVLSRKSRTNSRLYRGFDD